MDVTESKMKKMEAAAEIVDRRLPEEIRPANQSILLEELEVEDASVEELAEEIERRLRRIFPDNLRIFQAIQSAPSQPTNLTKKGAPIVHPEQPPSVSWA